MIGILGGCGRQTPTTAPATAPAAGPATAATTQAVSVEAAKLRIDGREFVFTPAVLVLQGQAPRLDGKLYNEGGDAANPGDAFYLDLSFELDENAPLGEATCRYRTDDRERSDSPVGIFVPGEKARLQAQELSVDLDEPSGGTIGVKISGKFLVFPDDTDVVTRIVPVEGKIRARLEQK